MIIEYFKNLVQFDSNNCESRNADDMRGGFESYVKNMFAKPKQIGAKIAILAILAYSFIFFAGKLNIFVVLTLIGIWMAIFFPTVFQFNSLNPAKFFADYFTNFVIIPEKLIKESNYFKISSTIYSRFNALCCYRNNDILFSINSKNNKPEAVLVFDTDYSYLFNAFVSVKNIDLSRLEHNMRSPKFSSNYDYSVQEGFVHIVAKKEISNDYVKDTRYKTKGEGMVYRPFNSTEIAMAYFNFVTDVFEIVS